MQNIHNHMLFYTLCNLEVNKEVHETITIHSAL